MTKKNNSYRKCWNCGSIFFMLSLVTDADGVEHYIARCNDCSTEFNLRNEVLEL
jgi:DNA-directed RNA polymerase subunit RPC12/RpoP